MLGLLGGSHVLATILLATWGLGTLGVATLATALLRGDRRVVMTDPHEAAIFAAARSRRWGADVAHLAPATVVPDSLTRV